MQSPFDGNTTGNGARGPGAPAVWAKRIAGPRLSDAAMKTGNGPPRCNGRNRGEPSRSGQGTGHGKEGSAVGDRQSTKIEVLCKECGRPFIKYTYSRLSRCEVCRKSGEAPLQGNKR